MTTLDDLNSIPAALSFALWAFAVIGVRKAVFDSFPVLELRWWLKNRGGAQLKARELEQLRWELNHRKVYNAAVAAGDTMTATPDLTPAQWAERRERLQKLAGGTMLTRALGFLMMCLACQLAWSALLLLAVTDWPGLVAAIVTAFAYSAFALVLMREPAPLDQAPTPGLPPVNRTGGCRSCGGRNGGTHGSPG